MEYSPRPKRILDIAIPFPPPSESHLERVRNQDKGGQKGGEKGTMMERSSMGEKGKGGKGRRNRWGGLG